VTVHVTNEILYDIADLADNIEENFGSQYADVSEQEIKETLENLGDRFNQFQVPKYFIGAVKSEKSLCALLLYSLWCWRMVFMRFVLSVRRETGGRFSGRKRIIHIDIERRNGSFSGFAGKALINAFPFF